MIYLYIGIVVYVAGYVTAVPVIGRHQAQNKFANTPRRYPSQATPLTDALTFSLGWPFILLYLGWVWLAKNFGAAFRKAVTGTENTFPIQERLYDEYFD